MLSDLNLKCDLHTHTVASGHAFATVDELMRKASSKELELVAITDHGPGLPGGAHPYHFWNLRILPRVMYGVKLLRGVEANVIDLDGTLDLDEELLNYLDIVGAGFHPLCGYDGQSEKENSQALINAIKRYRQIDVLVHPGNTWYPIIPDEVIDVAIEHGVLIELNNSSFITRPGSYENCLAIARKTLERGGKIVISSDAHMADDVGSFGRALKLAEDVGFSEDMIVNRTAKSIIGHLETRKGHNIDFT